MTNFPNARSADIGKLVPPAPTTEEPKRPAEGASTRTGYLGHAKSNDELPRSDHGRLEPSFDRFSKILAADIDRDSKQREALMNNALGITAETILRARLGDAVRSNQLTVAEANRYWELRFPGVRPEDVK